MRNSLRTSEDYELFIYTIADQFPSVRRSTVTLIRRGATIARVTGEIYFDSSVRLVVRERLVYNRLPVVIDSYGYEAWRGDKKLYWYDSQPHPNDPDLQSTNPHHKHIPPNIKNHRIPAPEMSFTQPNLPTLILEIEAFINEFREQSKV